jgi:DNA-binding NarL/FixJ family response regulator
VTRIRRGDLETHDRSALEALSPRELQVLRLVAEGKTSKDIAALLNLGLQTVRSYRKTMMKKLGVSNVAGLTQLALAAGLTHWNKPDAHSLG